MVIGFLKRLFANKNLPGVLFFEELLKMPRTEFIDGINTCNIINGYVSR